MVTKKAILIVNTSFDEEWGKQSVTLSNFDPASVIGKTITAFSNLGVEQTQIDVYENVPSQKFIDLFPSATTERESSVGLEEVVFVYIFSQGCPEGVFMHGVNEIIPFHTIVDLVKAAYSKVIHSEVVLIFDCGASGALLTALYDVSNPVTQPTNVSIICSTETAYGAAKFLPSAGQSAFGVGFCKLCTRTNEFLNQSTNKKMRQLFKDILRQEIGQAVKIHSDAYRYQASAIANGIKIIKEIEKNEEFAELPRDYQDYKINTVIDTLTHTVHTSKSIPRISHTASMPAVLWSGTANYLFRVIWGDVSAYVDADVILNSAEFSAATVNKTAVLSYETELPLNNLLLID